MRHRIDWIATHNAIQRFLAEEVSEFELKHEAKRLMTTPQEIAERTELSVRIVKAHLSEMARKKADGVAVVRVGRTEVVVRLR